MSQISDLIVSEYQQAYALLHHELMFQAKDLTPVESWKLKDDLDLKDFGGSYPSSSEFLEGCWLRTGYIEVFPAQLTALVNRPP